MAEHLHNHVGRPEDLGAPGSQLRALGGVIAIQVTGGQSRAGFHHDLEAGLRQARNDGGHQRDAPLAGKALPGNTDDHTTMVLTPEQAVVGASHLISSYDMM